MTVCCRILQNTAQVCGIQQSIPARSNLKALSKAKDRAKWNVYSWMDCCSPGIVVEDQQVVSQETY